MPVPPVPILASFVTEQSPLSAFLSTHHFLFFKTNFYAIPLKIKTKQLKM
jgi:hypothetical protein